MATLISVNNCSNIEANTTKQGDSFFKLSAKKVI